MILDTPEFSVQPSESDPCPDDMIVFSNGGTLGVEAVTEETFRFPRLGDLFPMPYDKLPLFDLGSANGRTLYLWQGDSPDFSKFGLLPAGRSEIRKMDVHSAGMLAVCLHLMKWYEDNRFCGSCGGETEPLTTMRALKCKNCGRLLFPVICPAVITAITCGDRILLARNVNRSNYALIAGYVEVGETLEHAVVREGLEETGLHLKNLCYLGNQPWGLSGAHMFAFKAEADIREPIRIQESELADARWFSREELAPQEKRLSIASELIERFRIGCL